MRPKAQFGVRAAPRDSVHTHGCCWRQVRLSVVRAVHDGAAAYYAAPGLKPALTAPYNLYLLLSDGRGYLDG